MSGGNHDDGLAVGGFSPQFPRTRVLRMDEVWGAAELLTDKDNRGDQENLDGDANPFLGLGLMQLGSQELSCFVIAAICCHGSTGWTFTLAHTNMGPL